MRGRPIELDIRHPGVLVWLPPGAKSMNRRNLLKAAPIAAMLLKDKLIPEAGAAPPLPWAGEKSRLKITGIRLVPTRPKRPLPQYTPSPGSWSTQGVEVANPMSIYPEYKA